MNNFYVYIWLDLRKPGKYVYGEGEYCFLYEPFYIGKGHGPRWKEPKWSRNDHFIKKFKKIKKCGFDLKVIKVKENIINEESIKLEIELIDLIGREDLGKGPLVNLIDGGDGSIGWVPSEEWRKKRSEKMKGENNPMFGVCLCGENNPNYGKHTSEETRELMSEKKKGENNPMFGKHHTEETKNKQSEKNKGKNSPLFGKHPSEETRKLISKKVKGENNSNSILTEKNVIKIRKHLKEGILKQREIGKKFGVSQLTISNIKLRRSWKHIK